MKILFGSSYMDYLHDVLNEQRNTSYISGDIFWYKFNAQVRIAYMQDYL